MIKRINPNRQHFPQKTKPTHQRTQNCIQIITYESPRGGVSVVTKRDETSTSFLLITNARTSDSGQYTCNPSNSKPKTVTVHVLNGKLATRRHTARDAVVVVSVRLRFRSRFPSRLRCLCLRTA